MTRGLYLPFGIAAYVVFLATFLYPIAVFGLRHGVMARPGFRAAWARLVPPPIERSVYVLLAGFAPILPFAVWRPIPTPVWIVASASLARG